MAELFRICTFNCNGLNDYKKRKDVFDFLREQKASIYFLQETHWKLQCENFIRSCWGYDCYVSGKESNKNGVAVLFSNNFEYKVHNVKRDPEGCYIVIDIEFNSKRVSMINIYGNSRRDDPDFFLNICKILEEIGNENIILGGDWNVVLDPKLDARNSSSLSRRPRSREKIIEMMALFDLVDIWRQIYPDKRGYTWRRFNSFQQSRLDYFLISDSLLTDVKGVKVLSGYRSDHSMVFLELESNRKKKDRQFWKFNNALLKDKEYMQIIKKVIKDVKNQYAALVYDFDNLDTIPEEYIQFRINDQLFFETLLMEIRGKTISYATFKKKEENKLEKQLIDDINQLEARLPNFSVEDLEEKKAQLEELRTRKLEGMIIRSRARWLQDGEKTSRYFCNLEKRNYLDKSMHFLEVDNGELTFDNDEIVKETKLFYEHLYAAKDVVDIDLNDIISDAPTLDEDEKELLEGPILYEEAVSALKAMKNNKSPGSDGFTCEFFKFFFCDIGTFLVRSLNFGFQAGYMSITQRFGTITLIPKESKPKHFLKNWRPISLLNTAYKIASSCIAARIKAVLYKLIHKNQTGFLKGRYIGENIRLLYDILLFTEEENIPGQILTVDFEKAFDSVSWVFIQKVLDFLNFGQDLKNWIKAFYNDISACVAVNGRYTSAFKICRGVRQGDPLSPYLYLLCAEILSLLIRKNDRIRGLTIQGTEHLLSQFADDTTVYLDGSEISFNETIRLLERFACMSGLKINHEKTNVIWIGCMKNSRKRYMRDKNFCWDPGIFTVLGIKFTTAIDQIVNINYEGKLKLIKNILVKWKKRHLTPFGKITVIKTLALSKLIYLFSNLPDPNYNFLQELDTLFFIFCGTKN